MVPLHSLLRAMGLVFDPLGAIGVLRSLLGAASGLLYVASGS